MRHWEQEPSTSSIEMAFAKIKVLLRKAAARTKENVEAAIAAAIDAVSPQNAINNFAAHGYQADTV